MKEAPTTDTQQADDLLSQQLQHIIDHKTKPLGALGMLEQLALQIGMVFQSTTPSIKKPHIVVFAADHGIAKEGVSAYPPEVTAQMVLNFVNGGAAINVFCRQHGVDLTIVDAGVNYEFAPDLPVVNNKIGKGTASFLSGPAMQIKDVYTCLQKGGEVVHKIAAGGCNAIGFGEMGIGNTSCASVLMSTLCNLPINECVGKGTGVSEDGLRNKIRVLEKAIATYKGSNDVYSIMAHFGGFEVIQMAGAMLAAKAKNMLLLVDGFIATSAFLCACKIDPSIKENAVFCHQSNEQAHKRLLEILGVTPLLQLNMRLGEGTGCALAFPLIQSAVAFLNEMASFEAAGVSNKDV
jgi:nicotinate-nucleotide--dimethylbenzimidazole phosphoribosyltransferase